MSFLERGLLGLHSGAWLSLLGMSVLSLARGADLNLLSDQVGGGRWLFLLGWLVLGVGVAAVGQLRRALQVTLGLTAMGLVTLALVGAHEGGGAMQGGLGLLAAICVGSAVLLARAKVQKTRPPRRRVRRANAAPRANLRRDGLGLIWTAAMTALVSSLAVAWLHDDADVRGRASVLLLVVTFIVLPLSTLACWRPQPAALGLASVSVLATLGLFTAASSALALGLMALWMAAVGAGLHQWRRRTY